VQVHGAQAIAGLLERRCIGDGWRNMASTAGGCAERENGGHQLEPDTVIL
jgi:hypothetical protein